MPASPRHAQSAAALRSGGEPVIRTVAAIAAPAMDHGAAILAPPHDENTARTESGIGRPSGWPGRSSTPRPTRHDVEAAHRVYVGLSIWVVGAGIALDEGASIPNTVLWFAIPVALGVIASGRTLVRRR